MIPNDNALPPHLAKQMEMLTLGTEGPMNVQSCEYSGMYASLGIDNSFNLNKFKKGLSINIDENKSTKDTLVFDIIGVSAPIANALRRIMISEVPTVAIDTVTMYINTGVVQDETLCHRIGLVPFIVDPDKLNTRESDSPLDESNSLLFSLKVHCTKGTLSVYSKDIVWVQRSEAETERWKEDPPTLVIPNILLTKLRPGQEIELECYLEKGTGSVHAKWSPVATATYRLKPFIQFPEGPMTGSDGKGLVELCPMKVFDIEDGVCVVRNAMACTSCRVCFEQYPNRVEVNKLKQHFIFTVESTGAIPPHSIVKRSLQILLNKAKVPHTHTHTVLFGV
eukprot:GHVR01177546.1.p1 GENE.GHVR01177546.1~~GHVR01177546.1.p1  ORF type:complete len:337 (+),score=96.89 GHVR01177546.1:61-1071(+)